MNDYNSFPVSKRRNVPVGYIRETKSFPWPVHLHLAYMRMTR